MKHIKDILKLIPIFIWHLLYLVFANSIDKFSRVYFDLIFYLGIAIYFYLLKDWNFSKLLNNIKKGRIFWFPVLFLILGIVSSFGFAKLFSNMFPNINDGIAVFAVHNWTTLIAFSLVTMVLTPIAEEVFYRKAITQFNSKSTLLFTTLVSMIMYASVHSLEPLGFLKTCLWAIPFNIAYLKTKNVYINITAHFMVNFIVNGITIITSALNLINV